MGLPCRGTRPAAETPKRCTERPVTEELAMPSIRSRLIRLILDAAGGPASSGVAGRRSVFVH